MNQRSPDRGELFFTRHATRIEAPASPNADELAAAIYERAAEAIAQASLIAMSHHRTSDPLAEEPADRTMIALKTEPELLAKRSERVRLANLLTNRSRCPLCTDTVPLCATAANVAMDHLRNSRLLTTPPRR